ncbi:MAG: bifunctional hydroxymethylpyrimidine kinase/phosphomethylpyrimidine kinase [Bacteroidales bacterium]|nr:bifunctional hydroxymethylpyrimidine kinase/phosphomethylpyrimidine kinase [Bacteroidales bacterium]
MVPRRVLTIAGSDSGGGAGIQADIKTISACGCYAMSAITAITVQNTQGVSGVHPIPVDIINGQIEVVLSDIGADAIKIGMLNSSEVIIGIRETLERLKFKNIVLDPVMVATSGDKLMQDEAIETLRTVLIPYARVITPNIPEAEILSGMKINNQNDMPECAKKLSAGGSVSVLLKAGHLTEDNLVDIFYNAETGETIRLESKRIYTRNTHGTGCTLSSALASFIALGYPLTEAAIRAKDYINEAIIHGAKYEIGHGHGPVDHFYKFR